MWIEGSGMVVLSGVVVVDPQWCAWKTTFLVSTSNSQSWGVETVVICRAQDSLHLMAFDMVHGAAMGR